MWMLLTFHVSSIVSRVGDLHFINKHDRIRGRSKITTKSHYRFQLFVTYIHY
jgi:hypothetical protein